MTGLLTQILIDFAATCSRAHGSSLVGTCLNGKVRTSDNERSLAVQVTGNGVPWGRHLHSSSNASVDVVCDARLSRLRALSPLILAVSLGHGLFSNVCLHVNAQMTRSCSRYASRCVSTAPQVQLQTRFGLDGEMSAAQMPLHESSRALLKDICKGCHRPENRLGNRGLDWPFALTRPHVDRLWRNVSPVEALPASRPSKTDISNRPHPGPPSPRGLLPAGSLNGSQLNVDQCS